MTAKVVVDDPLQAAIGSCNTVVFGTPHHAGANTDYSGFIKAFRRTFGDGEPGHVAIAGAGGVGKAIAFALAALGADFLAIYDTDRRKADRAARRAEAILSGAAGACRSRCRGGDGRRRGARQLHAARHGQDRRQRFPRRAV